MRKLAGILAQTGGDDVVIGIGLNVSMTADELPVADGDVAAAVRTPRSGSHPSC